MLWLEGCMLLLLVELRQAERRTTALHASGSVCPATHNTSSSSDTAGRSSRSTPPRQSSASTTVSTNSWRASGCELGSGAAPITVHSLAAQMVRAMAADRKRLQRQLRTSLSAQASSSAHTTTRPQSSASSSLMSFRTARLARDPQGVRRSLSARSSATAIDLPMATTSEHLQGGTTAAAAAQTHSTAAAGSGGIMTLTPAAPPASYMEAPAALPTPFSVVDTTATAVGPGPGTKASGAQQDQQQAALDEDVLQALNVLGDSELRSSRGLGGLHQNQRHANLKCSPGQISRHAQQPHASPPRLQGSARMYSAAATAYSVAAQLHDGAARQPGAGLPGNLALPPKRRSHT